LESPRYRADQDLVAALDQARNHYPAVVQHPGLPSSPWQSAQRWARPPHF
jgi:hypothetical protein